MNHITEKDDDTGSKIEKILPTLIIESLRNEFGLQVASSMIETACTQCGVSKKKLLTDYELFSKVIKKTYPLTGEKKILTRIEDDLSDLGLL